IITSTKVKPRCRHMCEIYDLAAKSQCDTQTWSVGVLERRKSDRRGAPPSVAPTKRPICRQKRRAQHSAEPIGCIAPSSVVPFLLSATSWWNTGMHACAPSGLLACRRETGFKPVWHPDLRVYVSPRSDNEPLKNGNRATACRSSIC